MLPALGLMVDIVKGKRKYILDSANLFNPNMSAKDYKKIDECLTVVFDKVDVPRARLIRACYDAVWEEIVPSNSMARELPVYNFTKIKKLGARAKELRKAFETLLNNNPLDVLCAIVYKNAIHLKGEDDVRSKKAAGHEDLILPNDVTLEIGYVFPRFSDVLSGENENVLVYLPSPHFIRHYINKVERSRPVTFVVENEDVSGLISTTSYFSKGKARRCVSVAQWRSQFEASREAYSHVLLFANRASALEIQELIRLLKDSEASNIQMMALMPGQYMEGAGGKALRRELTENCTLDEVLIIPQGINNSAKPKRKVFLKAQLNPTAESDAPICIQSLLLGDDPKRQHQYLSLDESYLELTPQDFVGTDVTLRAFCTAQMLARKEQHRESSIPFDITPDITGYFVMHEEPQHPGKVRIQAYVKETMKENGTYCETENSRKRVTSIAQEDVYDWLENSYPYETVHHRQKAGAGQDSGEYEQLEEDISIRDVIIQASSIRLAGENIALETLAYLYPNLEDYYTEREYEEFMMMVRGTGIGLLRVQDITTEVCEEQLQRAFPGASDVRLWRYFRIISTALAHAVRNGYCHENELRQAEMDRTVRDRLFQQVRNVLTKKHLDEDEMVRVVEECISRIHDGHIEFIGVLVRLLTGLEGDIVCGLTWGDFIHDLIFDLYQLVISRRIAGKTGIRTAFTKTKQYRSVPCMDILAEELLFVREEIQSVLGRGDDLSQIPLVTSMERILHGEKYQWMQPSELAGYSQEILRTIDWDKRVLLIWDQNKGYRETDLNEYLGDIFRENFRFWGLMAAHLSVDELSFLISNQPETTLGRYYVDFFNAATTFSMYRKLQRWNCMLKQKGKPGGIWLKAGPTEEMHKRFEAMGASPLSLMGDISTEEEVPSRLKIEVGAAYGIRTELMPLKKEEDAND